MTAVLALRCDVPRCGATFDGKPRLGNPKSTGVVRARGKEKGWSTTRVANPFREIDGYGLKTIQLDRCPGHRKVRLEILPLDDDTYAIELAE